MQKIVGNSDIEHYPTVGIVNKLDIDMITRSVDEFQRTFNLGHFMLRNFTPDMDYIKPSKIKDLHIVESDLESKIVKLVFTAPGDDADLGTAIYYDIKCSYDLEYLIRYESSNENSTEDEYILPISLASSSFKNYKPNQGGTKEYFVLITDIYSSNEDILGLKLRASDASGNLGEWSNMVIVKLNNEIKFSPHMNHFAVGANKLAAYTAEKSTLMKMKEDRYFYYFLIFIACLSLILIVQIVMIAVLTLNKLRYAREKSNKKGKLVCNNKKEEFERLDESQESEQSVATPMPDELLIQRV